MPIMPARLGGRPLATTLRAPRPLAAPRVESLALVLGTATPRTLVAEPSCLWLDDLAETTARAWADHVLKDCTAKEDAVAAGAKETWLSGWRVK